MSGLTPNENTKHEEMPGFTLTKALEEVSQQGYATMAALKEKLNQLGSLQTILTDAEKSNEKASLEQRAVARRTLALDEDLHQCQSRSQALWSRCRSANSLAAALRLRVDEEDEDARRVLSGHDEYRRKMAGHRAAVALAESKTESHRVLEAKRQLVRELKLRREELRRDLEDPNGKAMQDAKTGKEHLQRQVVALRNAVASKGEELRQEFDAHAQIRKEIQIQSRRYEAILRRLHCQLNKAQAYHRHLAGDVYHLEKEVTALRRQLNSS